MFSGTLKTWASEHLPAPRAHVAALLCALAIASLATRPAGAVVINLANTANTSPSTSAAGPSFSGYWDNVVSVNGASAVYLGSGWVLTAAHVGAGSFVYDGVTYFPGTSYSNFNTPTLPPGTADLTLFQIASSSSGPTDPALPNVPIQYGNVPGVGTFVNDAGNGYTAGASTGNGFSWAGSVGETWGSNNTADASVVTPSASGPVIPISVTVGSNTYTSYDLVTQFTNGGLNTSQLAPGDSGGGLFALDTLGHSMLVGLNEAIGSQNSNSATYGDYSVYVAIGEYASQIQADTGGVASPLTFDVLPTPEPSSFLLAAAGLAGAGATLWRRRNQGRAKAAAPASR